MRNVRIFKIDVKNKKTMFLDVASDDIFKQLNYKYFDTTTRYIGDRQYVIICDDNGLNSNEAFSAVTNVSNQCVEQIHGSIIVTKPSCEDFVSLDAHDEKNILNNLFRYSDKYDMIATRPVLVLNLGY